MMYGRDVWIFFFSTDKIVQSPDVAYDLKAGQM